MNSVTRIFLPLSILISGISFGGTFKFYFSQILIEIVKKQHILTLFYFFKFSHCLTLFPIFSLFIFCDCDRGIMLRLSRWMPMGTTICRWFGYNGWILIWITKSVDPSKYPCGVCQKGVSNNSIFCCRYKSIIVVQA